MGQDSLIIARLTLTLLRVSVSAPGIPLGSIAFIFPPSMEQLEFEEAVRVLSRAPRPMTVDAGQAGQVVSVTLRAPTEVELELLDDKRTRFQRHFPAQVVGEAQILIRTPDETFAVPALDFGEWMGSVLCPECSFSIFPPTLNDAPFVAVVRFYRG